MNCSHLNPYLCKLDKLRIGGIVGDEKPHAFVGDLNRSRAIHFDTQI